MILLLSARASFPQPLPDIFLSFLSVEDLPPGALSPVVVSTLVRLAAGADAAAATRSQAADLLRRFLGEGLVSPDQTGVQIPWGGEVPGGDQAVLPVQVSVPRFCSALVIVFADAI